MARLSRSIRSRGIAPTQHSQSLPQIVRQAGGTTAYSDKHTAAYTMLQGPFGDALDEIYNPEQSANGAANLTDAQYDMLHVRSVAIYSTSNPKYPYEPPGPVVAA